MIPIKGSDPKINVVSLGGQILEELKDKGVSINQIFTSCPSKYEVSLDHIILTLDWLFAINAIHINGGEVFINEVN